MLHSDDKIEKFLPLIVPAALAGYGAYQGYKNVRDNRITDPVLGIVGTEGNDSLASNALEFGTGAAQGLGLGAATRKLGQGTANLFGRRVGSARAKQKAADEAARIAASKARTSAPARLLSRRRINRDISPQARQQLFTDAEQAAQAARNVSSAPLSRVGQKVGQKIDDKAYGLAATAGAARVGLDLLPGAQNALFGLAGAAAMNQMPEAPTTGFGASQMGTTGAVPTQGTQVSGNADPYALREIYKPQAGSAFEGQKEFGGLGVQKGDNMFRENIGEELLKEATERMDKAHCGTELKADEKDSKKKPAHGMVIVIGSKAGPGPSKDGKREKLDSEKKKE
tara:strand:+ start:4188 stop:5207 length:1020 start_codon:yes stop_codon:yes gene_type:complete